MDVVRNFKFGLQVNGSKSQPADDSHPWNGRGQGHVTQFRIAHPWNISGKVTARDFKFYTRVVHVKN